MWLLWSSRFDYVDFIPLVVSGDLPLSIATTSSYCQSELVGRKKLEHENELDKKTGLVKGV